MLNAHKTGNFYTFQAYFRLDERLIQTHGSLGSGM